MQNFCCRGFFFFFFFSEGDALVVATLVKNTTYPVNYFTSFCHVSSPSSHEILKLVSSKWTFAKLKCLIMERYVWKSSHLNSSLSQKNSAKGNVTHNLNHIRSLNSFTEKKNQNLTLFITLKISSLYSVACMFSRERRELEMFSETA